MPRSADVQTQRIIQDNWRRVTDQIAAACASVQRDPGQVQIVGVSKYVDAALTAQLVQAGCTNIGENRPQVLWEKFAYFQQQNLAMPRWHLIGHLQRNKVRRTLPIVDAIQAVDSLRLADELSSEAVKLGKTIPFLIDINLTQDDSKTGMRREELLEHLDRWTNLPNLQWTGLMAMSSLNASPESALEEFHQVREFRDSLQQMLGDRAELKELSMGMSGDYVQAIQAGSTCVRIGSSLWEGILT